MAVRSPARSPKNNVAANGNSKNAVAEHGATFNAEQLEPLLAAMQAARDGDFSVRLDGRSAAARDGVLSEIYRAFNEYVAKNETLSKETVRVARIVGREGRLTERAALRDAQGAWEDSVSSLNALITDLARPTTEIARVITAVAEGDLSQKMALEIEGTPVKGEFLRIRTTVNTMVDQLSSFAAEVTRVAREVGTEGKLGGQAKVPGVAGTWKDLTDNVNLMASNLTTQVRGIVKVVTAVADGDLSQRLVVDAKGEVAALADTLNSMTRTLSIFAEQVTTVAREVGTEGKLGGQANVPGVAGTWKDLTDNVNGLAGNLTNQVRNIALVTTAVANGDLSQKITVDVKGEVLELKNTINVMVDQLNSLAAEVTRVAREVGTEGKLGGQAEVKGVSGTWKDLTDNVNGLASNLTNQVRNIALVTTAVANGDLSQKITVNVRGEMLELKNTINVMVDQLNSFAAEVTRVAREVGTEGKLGGQAEVKGVSGTWKDLTDNVNFMASNLTTQVRGIVKVVTAVADGDLSQKLAVEAKGEVAALADTINSMTDTLSIFAEQVTTVAREVGTEGKLGGQARVPNVAGTWKDLTDNVNFMASNLTTQVRGIARVVTAVANGDLSQKLAVEAKGEVAALADTINAMTETLSIFAEQVTTVAREVGAEGKLGGQANVPNVAGTWKDLTENVNFMANSLTVQVRAISDVATSVTEGDLTRTITVDAQGEVQALKNNVNQMISNLKSTTQLNNEQDWLKTNLARFSRLMQGQKNLEDVARLIMSELTPLVSAHHGAFFTHDSADRVLELMATYAYRKRKAVPNRFEFGEGLVGQCALEKKSILMTKVPDDYIQINSGLGESAPRNIIVLPVLFEGDIMAAIELASFNEFSDIHLTFLDQLVETLGVVLNMIGANMRTEELLQQSQSLTQELQSQSEELQSQQDQLRTTNTELENQARELEEKAEQLAEQNIKVEQKNHEVELARSALEEKAEQLALSSKYKSEFLANMSHELRTPLNSMLILAKLLSENNDDNLSPKQIEFASTIYSSGGDLLKLINEILDLSKVESGKMEVEVDEVALSEIGESMQRTFAPVAGGKGLEFNIEIARDAPETLQTDTQRLDQVLKNMLSNALKFTEKGSVTLTMRLATRDEYLTGLNPRNRVLAFEVTDTGIGIPRDKQQLIFEAFQQVDGTTNRKYGGTGLGLSISREITRLLGGRLQVRSVDGEGSTFTLFLPQFYEGDDASESIYRKDSFDDGDSSGGSSNGLRRAPTEISSFETSPSAIRDEFDDEVLTVVDDRDNLQANEPFVLIVEDDRRFAQILLDTARANGFKGLVAFDGEDALRLAQERKPSAITLDLRIPKIDGWTLLDHLKRDSSTRHIPVHVISVLDRERGSTVSAISYLEKPVSRAALEGAFSHIRDFLERDLRELLIVEDDEGQRTGLIELIGSGDVVSTGVGSAQEALRVLEQKKFDCMILDLGLPDMAGIELLRRIKTQPRWRDLPVVIYTSYDLSRAEEAQLKRYASTIITKDAASSERLLEQLALFLHRVAETSETTEESKTSVQSETTQTNVEPKLTRRSRKSSTRESNQDTTLAAKKAAEVAGIEADISRLSGRKVLVVDDDMRNIFALTSVLESHEMTVLFAESGQEALEVMRATLDIAMILMDIMMPDMDGYETTRQIRALDGVGKLPILALTAKAMTGDREKCLEAGASDYITKPVDTDKLLAMMSRWMEKL